MADMASGGLCPSDLRIVFHSKALIAAARLKRIVILFVFEFVKVFNF